METQVAAESALGKAVVCVDGYAAVTRDGVVVDPNNEYWRIANLEQRDFQGLHDGKIPNKALAVLGQEIIDRGGPWGYASTREEANIAAVEKYLNQEVERRIQAGRHELSLLEQHHLKIRGRLNASYKNTP